MRASLKTGDKALIAVLIAALVGGTAWWALSGNGGAADAKRNAAGYMVVTQTKDGQRRVDPLGREAEFSIETPGTGVGEDAKGGENTVRIQDGTVDVTYSNCSNQVCADHDPVAQPGEQIVCLPHGLVIEVVKREEDAARLQ